MSDEVKLLPCEAIARMQRQLDCGNGLVEDSNPPIIRVLVSDLRAAIEATRPPIGTDEVVERVARALYQTTACEAERTAPDCAVPGFDEDDEDARQFCRELARASIAAMKDAASV